ncbi:MAG: hypothetical protein J6W70_06895 [Lentisphaeria bacterium]|nr:hypothetical protein [Lentisphaeria bacterium]
MTRSAPCPRNRHRVRPAILCLASLAALFQSCIFGDAEIPPDTVSPERTQLIVAAGGFICLYRSGANPADLLYVKAAANDAGLEVVFKIAESAVIPEAIRKGWGDVAVGFTSGEAKGLGLRVVSVPRAADEFNEDAGSGVYLLRSGDTFLESLLDPDKHPSVDPAGLRDVPAPDLTDRGMPPARISADPADVLQL